MVQFIPSDNPKPPTRQLLETSVVKDWDMVPAELVTKYWNSCGHPTMYLIRTTNKTTNVPYIPEQTKTILEILCGPY